MLKIILCCCLAGLSVCHPVMAAVPQLGRQYSVVENTLQNSPEVMVFLYLLPAMHNFSGNYRVSGKWSVTDYHGLKIRKNVINQTIYGLIRTFEEVEMVPIIGVEPTTFALRMRCSTN